jgi:hypothetical protein
VFTSTRGDIISRQELRVLLSGQGNVDIIPFFQFLISIYIGYIHVIGTYQWDKDCVTSEIRTSRDKTAISPERTDVSATPTDAFYRAISTGITISPIVYAVLGWPNERTRHCSGLNNPTPKFF